MVLKLSQIVPFLQFFADVSRTSKAAMTFYVYSSESSCFGLLENGIGYFPMA